MTTAAESVPEVGPDEGRALVEGGAVLLDVREADEWQAGHAAEAVWIPLGEIAARANELRATELRANELRATELGADELPVDRRIVAICRSGGRSERATRFLRAQGFDVVNLAGGMRAWAAAGLDVVTDDGQPGAVI
jgi:rhodanese-related sulfurtransferase